MLLKRYIRWRSSHMLLPPICYGSFKIHLGVEINSMILNFYNF